VWISLEKGWVADLNLADWKVTYAKADVDGRRIAVSTEDVYVLTSSDDGGYLQRIDPKTHKTVGKPVKGGGAPSDLDAYVDSVLEMTAFAPTVTNWDADLGDHRDTKIPIDGVPADMHNSPPDMFVTDFSNDVLVRFDTITGKRIAKIPMPEKPDGIAEDGDILWVATQSGFVQRVNSKTNKKVGPVIDPGPLTGDIQAELGVAWAAGPSYLVRIEPRSQMR
jgi:DNA-binding beta-propeller fold protein YncE